MAVLRALFILSGGAIAGHALATRAADARPGRIDRPPPFWSWLADAISPDASVTAAIGNTMVLAVAGIFLGCAFGALIGAVSRAGRPGRLLGGLIVTAMAMAVPGFVLFPLADAAAGWNLVPAQAVSLNDSAGDGFRFLLLWGSLVAVAVTPAVVSLFAAGAGRGSAAGSVVPSPIRAWSAARPEAVPDWRFGFPSTVFLVTLAVAELLSGHPGIFPLFFESLGSSDLEPALAVLFWTLLGGAGLAVAVDLAGAVTRDPTVENNPVGPEPSTTVGGGVTADRTMAAAGAVTGLLVVIAVLGSLLGDPSATAEAGALAPPTIGGPWLGTDALGRDTLSTVTAALGPAMSTAVVAAVMATTLGTVVAWLRLGLGDRVGRFVNVAVDALWWPVPMIAPLALLATGDLDRPWFDPVVVIVVGLALVPLAARLLARSMAIGIERSWLGLAADAAAIAAVAASVLVVVNFAGYGGSNLRPGLGSLMAEAASNDDLSRWPFLAPAVALVSLVSAMTWLSASLMARSRQPSDIAALGGDGMEPGSDPTGVLPRSPLPDRSPPAVDVAPPVAVPTAEEAVARTAADGDIDIEAIEGTGAAVHLAPLDDVDPGPDGDATAEPEPIGDAASQSPIEREATKTIELRPSTLRQAGITAPTMPRSPTELSSGWSKPALAARPAPAEREPQEDRSDPEST